MAIAGLYGPFLEVARADGVDVRTVLAGIGFSETEMESPDTRLSPDQGRTLVRRLRALCGKREIGLLAAERFELSGLDLVGYMARNAWTAMDAIQTLARYGRLLGDTADFRVERSERGVSIRLGLLGGDQMLPEGSDFAVAVAFRFLRDLSRGTAVPLEVHLPRSRPRSPGVYRRFFGVPVVFGADCGELLYSEKALSLAPLCGDARLRKILERQAHATLAGLPDPHSWLDRVRGEVVRALLCGRADLTSVAARCGVSDRTLRRRLKQANTCFRAVVDDARRVRALGLIEGGERSVTALAHQVGYGDATAFARAFRRWTGMAPQRYLSSEDCLAQSQSTGATRR